MEAQAVGLAQQVGSDRADRGLGRLGARVGMVAIGGGQQRAVGLERRLRLVGLERLQCIGLRQPHLVLGERRAAHDLGQQFEHRRGMAGQGVGIDRDAVVAGACADAAAVALRGLGDGARIALGGALGEQAGEQAGETVGASRVGGESGVAHRQHVVHARHAVARYHPHFQAVAQHPLLDLGDRQRLVLAERRQILRQRRGGTREGGAGHGQRHGQGQEADCVLHGRLLIPAPARPRCARRGSLRARGRSRCGWER